MRIKLRDVVVFIAGAEFMHTIAHIVLYYRAIFPINMGYMMLTEQLNTGAIMINALITILLLWWARKLS